MSKGRNPRAAGRRFEQRIARDLRRWLGDDWEISRNQTDRQKGQTGDAGEFAFTGPFEFPFCVECKDGYGFDPRQLFKDPIPGPLSSTASAEGFWAQADRQALTVGLRPLLVFRRSGVGTTLVAAQAGVLGSVVKLAQVSGRARVRVDGDRLDVVPWAILMSGNPGGLYDLANAPQPPV